MDVESTKKNRRRNRSTISQSGEVPGLDMSEEFLSQEMKISRTNNSRKSPGLKKVGGSLRTVHRKSKKKQRRSTGKAHFDEDLEKEVDQDDVKRKVPFTQSNRGRRASVNIGNKTITFKKYMKLKMSHAVKKDLEDENEILKKRVEELEENLERYENIEKEMMKLKELVAIQTETRRTIEERIELLSSVGASLNSKVLDNGNIDIMMFFPWLEKCGLQYLKPLFSTDTIMDKYITEKTAMFERKNDSDFEIILSRVSKQDLLNLIISPKEDPIFQLLDHEHLLREFILSYPLFDMTEDYLFEFLIQHVKEESHTESIINVIETMIFYLSHTISIVEPNFKKNFDLFVDTLNEMEISSTKIVKKYNEAKSMEKDKNLTLPHSLYIPTDPFDFLSCNNEEIARQLCLISEKLMQTLKITDIQHNFWTENFEKSSIFPIKNFTDSMHDWVLTEILRINTPEETAQMIEKFIHILHHLFEMKNGLLFSSIVIVFDEYFPKLDSIHYLISKDSLSILEDLQSKNIGHNPEEPHIPSLDLKLETIRSYNETMKNFQDNENCIINWLKGQTIGNQIWEIIRSTSYRHKFHRVTDIQKYFLEDIEIMTFPEDSTLASRAHFIPLSDLRQTYFSKNNEFSYQEISLIQLTDSEKQIISEFINIDSVIEANEHTTLKRYNEKKNLIYIVKGSANVYLQDYFIESITENNILGLSALLEKGGIEHLEFVATSHIQYIEININAFKSFLSENMVLNTKYYYQLCSRITKSLWNSYKKVMKNLDSDFTDSINANSFICDDNKVTSYYCKVKKKKAKICIENSKITVSKEKEKKEFIPFSTVKEIFKDQVSRDTIIVIFIRHSKRKTLSLSAFNDVDEVCTKILAGWNKIQSFHRTRVDMKLSQWSPTVDELDIIFPVCNKINFQPGDVIRYRSKYPCLYYIEAGECGLIVDRRELYHIPQSSIFAEESYFRKKKQFGKIIANGEVTVRVATKNYLDILFSYRQDMGVKCYHFVANELMMRLRNLNR